jgi:serine/threonine protein kinase
MSESTSFGKYRLIAELGHGGMADVFLAVQAGPLGSGFSKLTVIKRLRPNLAEEPEFVSMLVDEARIAARLNHPNVVQTNEVGEYEGQYFIAMEYLDGQPFHRIQHRMMQRVKDGTPAVLTKEQQYVIVMDALAGLHHAHELVDYDGTPLGVVHRDITPHNIFVTYEGQVKVVDFGIAKAVGRASETRQGVVKGKVRYMAPEQAIGHDVDRRADVFAAGVMLWEIAAGRRMWKDMDDLRIVQALVSNEVPASPREFDPTVPEAVDKICRRALALKADERYETADEFRSELESFLAEAGHLVDARRKLPGAVADLFKDKRAEIRAVIERQIAMAASKPSGEFAAVKVAPTDAPSSSTPISVSVRESARDEPATSLTEQKTEVYQPRSRGRRAVVVAVAAAALCVGAILVWKKGSWPRADASASTATVSEEISLKLSSNPANVTVRIDDGAPLALPLERKVRRDNAKHALRFEADGFVGKSETVDFSRDQALAVDLIAVTPPSPDPKDNNKDRRQSSVAWSAPAPTARGGSTPTAKTASPPAPPPEPTTTAAPPATASATTPTPDRSGGNKRLGIDKTDPWGSPR